MSNASLKTSTTLFAPATRSVDKSFEQYSRLSLGESRELKQQAARVVSGRQQLELHKEGQYLVRLNLDPDRQILRNFQRVTQPTSSPSQRISGPIRFILKLLENWNLKKSDAVNLLGFEKGDLNYISNVLNGYEELKGRDVKDRVSLLLYIRKSLWIFFQDIEVENDWLREPQQMLGGREPLSLLQSGSMEDLLLLREFVDAMTGM